MVSVVTVVVVIVVHLGVVSVADALHDGVEAVVLVGGILDDSGGAVRFRK